jgi:peptide/nickel transport system substrate-binding protein
VEKNMPRTYRNLTLSVLFLILLPLGYLAEAQEKGGTLICLEKQLPDTYDPITSLSMPGLRLAELMFESLVYETDAGGYEGRLAKSWSFSKDSISISFHLRSNVKWCEINSEGEVQATQPFTAKDVLYTYQLIEDPRTDCDPSLKELLTNIKNPPKVWDDTTIEFQFKKKPIKPEENFTFKIVPAYKIKGGFITPADPFAHAPVGTGYYVFFKQIDKDNILKVNKAHYDETANIDRIKISYYADENMLYEQAMLARSVNAVIEARVQDIARYENSGQYNIRRYAPLSFHYLGYNLKNKLFADKRVRQALTYAIDRRRIIESRYLGEGEVISGPFPPASPLNNPDVKPLPADTAAAKRLLREAGWRETGEGWIFPDGTKLTFTLTLEAEQNDDAWRTAQAIIDYWKSIGIPVETQKVVRSTWIQNVYRDKNFEVTYAKWTLDRANDIRSLFKTGTEKNYVSYSNPTVDSLIRLLDNVSIPDERRTINYKLHQILADDCPYTFLWTLNRCAAISDKVRMSEWIHDFYFFTYINKWWIPEDFQE